MSPIVVTYAPNTVFLTFLFSMLSVSLPFQSATSKWCPLFRPANNRARQDATRCTRLRSGCQWNAADEPINNDLRVTTTTATTTTTTTPAIAAVGSTVLRQLRAATEVVVTETRVKRPLETSACS